MCLTHPGLGSEIYEIRACLLYPENCRGICWAFKDKRKKRTRIFNFFLGR